MCAYHALSSRDKAFLREGGGQMRKGTIMDEQAMDRALRRMAHEIVERNADLSQTVLVGIRRRGVPLAMWLFGHLRSLTGQPVETGELDITLYRDDLTERFEAPVVKAGRLPDLSGKRVILVDDVIYTGRTVRAALDALMDHGRPCAIELAVLIDRGHRELPIRADYVGKSVPTSQTEFISVRVTPYDGDNSVLLLTHTSDS